MSCEATENDILALRNLQVVTLAAIIAASLHLLGMHPHANVGSGGRLSSALCHSAR